MIIDTLTTAALTAMMAIPSDSLCIDQHTSDFPSLSRFEMVALPGQYQLTTPMRIDGTQLEMRTEEHGLAYPTIYDWNHDGRPDILMGEFLTGQSRIKVYLNVGTARKPKFTGEWTYATDTKGNVISNYEWCCIGIHPQIVDVNGDGILDIFSGQYFPGTLTWWKGTAEGFEPGRQIPQLGWQENKRFASNYDEPDWSIESHNYWNYSSARLADFNGDGLPDLWVAGCGGYRVALNDGTLDEPHFGRREFLFQVDGTILHTHRDEKIDIAPGKFFNAVNACSGSAHCYLNPYDWDGDGVMDIFITDELSSSYMSGVYFAHGVMTDDGIRYEQPIPIFKAKKKYAGQKLLPGCTPHVQIADYNSDGIPDLMMGLSIPTIRGFEGATALYYEYLNDHHLEKPGKDCGETLHYYSDADKIIDQIAAEPRMKQMFIGDLDDYSYMTLRHRGYPFVFLGTAKLPKRPNAQLPKRPNAQPKEFAYDHPYIIEGWLKEQLKKAEPVSCFTRVSSYDKKITVSFRTTGTWHLYTDAEVNRDQTPLTITFELPEGITLNGPMKTPPVIAAGGNEIYDGKSLAFEQSLNVSPSLPEGEYPIRIHVSYQTCSHEGCMPPTEITENETFKIMK